MTYHPDAATVARLQAELERTRRRLAWWRRQMHLNPRPLPEWVGDIADFEPEAE